MTPFDVQRAPLEGRNLIEAAAGTGKTWSIEQLFVRLVLEQGCRVDEILTVTFTQAATDELRDRIHRQLLAARRDARDRDRGGAGGAEDLSGRIESAIADFDRAAIYTIHGFCQRVLREHAFETGSSFTTELVPDQTALLREVTEDYWRRVLAAAPAEAVACLLARLKGPGGLLSVYHRIKAPVFRVLPQPAVVPLTALEGYRRSLTTLRALWAAEGDDALRLLADPCMNAVTFGSCKPGAARSRANTLREMRDALESLLEPGRVEFPPVTGIDRLCTSTIVSKTNKGKTAPRHRVFDACEELCATARTLEAELEQHLRQVKVEFLCCARDDLARRTRVRNLQSFDDLLLRLHHSLAEPGGEALAAAVRRRFRAVLVDEFQDTDALQYSIFENLFGRAEGCLFWIGDPKQAIYGFRGADIFAYLRAARSADTRYTLEDNHRSTPALVRAVNTLFSGSTAPFLFPQIEFRPARAAGEETGPPPGLVIWHMEVERLRGDSKPLPKAQAEPLIAGVVASEIRRLTSSAGGLVPAGGIAVLVRTNRQAQMVKQALSRVEVPAVVCSTGSIYDAPEAEEIHRILLSLAAPSDAARLKSALATSLLGATADELDGGDAESGWWVERCERQRAYAEQWQREGFTPMFRALLTREAIKTRLLGLPDGERRLTNALHLSELLHQAAAAGNLGPPGLARWLARQRDPSSPGRDEHPLRLESDAAAVQIVTIHKSKGLQYPVVFCPYAWSSSEVNAEDVLFHDPEAEHALTVAISPGPDSPAWGCAERELLSENLRLLYVALTRAKQRCYLAWGRINSSESSALAYLLHGSGLDAGDGVGDVAALLRERVKAKSDADVRADLAGLARRSEGAIEVLPLPDPSAGPESTPLPRATERLRCRNFTGAVDRSWRTGSYSFLVSGSHDPDAVDREPGLLPVPPRPKPRPDRAHILDFPAGSRAGSFFHAVLEAVDFGRWEQPSTERIIAEKLRAFGFEPGWGSAVARLVRDAAEAELFPEDGVSLGRLQPEDRIVEMEFYHPLNLLSPRVLRDVFARFGRAEALRGFPERLERLTFAPLRGHMKGFIDLVAVHRGRFYLLDWKSNYLGGERADYRSERLAGPMQDEFYVLQYHIYTLALDLYLRLRRPGYDYARDFGGVAYVFLRGLDRDAGPDVGVFRDRPEPELVRALGRALIPDYD